MANTNTFQKAPISDTDANFRLWGKAISDAFAAIGLIKDTDAAQINWATVAKPTGVSTMMGYEVWRFNDAIQATCPVYFKIQYGSSSASANIINIIMQVGQGSDNAGTLTGTTATATTFGSGTSSSTTYSCFISSDGGRINVAMFAGGGLSIPFGFYIERIKDDNGDPTANGVNIVYFGVTGAATASVSQQYLPLTGAAYPATPMTGFMCAMPSSGQASYGTNVGLFPIYPNLGYAANPDMGALVYFTGDIASPGTMLNVTMYGTTHTFVTLGNTTGAAVASLNGNTTIHSLAFRYE
jgi:hypothetical protein